MAHLDPLPATTTPELAEDFAIFERILGFVPNSLLTMQRRPAIVKGFGVLTKAVMDPDGAVDPGFKRLLAHFASRAAGCQYCEAHSLIAANLHDVSQEKLDAIWEYKSSPLYSEAERAGLDYALAAGSVPNGVDAEIMRNLKAHWDDDQIVEMLAAISLYGFLNHWNDSMATDIEEAPIAMGERVLSKGGWDGGKHRSNTPKIELSETSSGGKFTISDYAEMTFSKVSDNTISVDHTGVNPEHRGEGLAQDLYYHMLEYARTNSIKVIPACSFVHKMFMKNPQDQALMVK